MSRRLRTKDQLKPEDKQSVRRAVESARSRHVPPLETRRSGPARAAEPRTDARRLSRWASRRGQRIIVEGLTTEEQRLGPPVRFSSPAGASIGHVNVRF